MSEIRDEVLEDLLSIKGMTPDMLKAVFTHPNIAIVDRGVEIPQDTWFWKNCWRQRCKPAKICLECPFFDYKTHTLKGWVKEVKDGPSSK